MIPLHLPSFEYIFLSFIDLRSISKTPLVIWRKTLKKDPRRHILHQTYSRNRIDLQPLPWHLQNHSLEPNFTGFNCFKISLKFALIHKRQWPKSRLAWEQEKRKWHHGLKMDVIIPFLTAVGNMNVNLNFLLKNINVRISTRLYWSRYSLPLTRGSPTLVIVIPALVPTSYKISIITQHIFTDCLVKNKTWNAKSNPK